jgi:hypothetical protein
MNEPFLNPIAADTSPALNACVVLAESGTVCTEELLPFVYKHINLYSTRLPRYRSQ